GARTGDNAIPPARVVSRAARRDLELPGHGLLIAVGGPEGEGRAEKQDRRRQAGVAGRVAVAEVIGRENLRAKDLVIGEVRDRGEVTAGQVILESPIGLERIAEGHDLAHRLIAPECEEIKADEMKRDIA